jgi:hypothetical protein
MTMTTARYESGNAEEEDPLVLVCWLAVVIVWDGVLVVEADDGEAEEIADVDVVVETVVVVEVKDELWTCVAESWNVPVLPPLFPSPE